MENKSKDYTGGKGFWQWFVGDISNIIIAVIWVVISGLTILTRDEFSSTGMFLSFLGFFQVVGGIFWFKTIQAYNDAKKGRSR